MPISFCSVQNQRMTLFSFAIAFILGILIGSRFGISLPALGLFLIACGLLAALLSVTGRSIRPSLLLAVLLLGMLRVLAFDGDSLGDLDSLHGPTVVQVRGVVVDDPEPAGAFTRLRLRVESVNLNGEWLDTDGDALVTLRETADIVRQRDAPYFRYGDRLHLDGNLEAPPVLEAFDYQTYLARQGIGSVMSFPDASLLAEGEGAAFYRWLYGLRQTIADSLTRVVPEPQASVGQALLLGIRDNLPDDLVDDFRVTGTSHVLAISGLHVGILMGITLALGQFAFGRRHHLYLVLPLALIWLYALLSGMSPSATRASIMGTVYLLALLSGRPRNTLPALGLAATVMVALNPNVLWSVSFQLSFAAVAGIALMTEPVSRFIQRLLGAGDDSAFSPRSLIAAMSSMAAMTIAATVATFPLIAFYFERVSLVGIPSSLLVLPALPLVLVTQATAGLVGMLNTAIAIPFGWLAWLSTWYVTGIIGLLAKIPGASVELGGMSKVSVLLYYGLLIGLFVASRKAFVRDAMQRLPTPSLNIQDTSLFKAMSGLAPKGLSLWLMLPMVALATLIWTAALTQTDANLHVTFADVGQGDGILIVTPGGQQVIVDGGPDPLGFARLLGDSMPFSDRNIEMIVATHAHSDHIGGLIEVLGRYNVERIVEREINYDSPTYQGWRRAVATEGAEVIQAQAGQQIALDNGVFLQVINPPERLISGTASDTDNASVALRLVYGDISFLLTGDMFAEAERVSLGSNFSIDSDVLKVAHHGSRSSSIRAFIEGVSPVIAVISSGQDNGFGHPHVETLEILQEHISDNMLFQTAERGSIEFVTDGKHLEVITER